MVRKKTFVLRKNHYLRSRSVVLRGKHARLGKADIVQRDAARRAEQVDTLSAHRSIDKADHYARDNVGIMKPPDVVAVAPAHRSARGHHYHHLAERKR